MKNFSENPEARKEIEYYHNQGCNLIAVRDKVQGKFSAKSPYNGWKRFQTVMITIALLYIQLEKFATTAVAIVGGKVSGNLFCIDVDTKNWAGIDVLLYEQIEKFMPDVWGKLRIHKTPSGGRHIIFRVEDYGPTGIPEGNKKLAWKKGAKEAALETRSEGGYFLSTACLGYSVEFDRPIPTITWLEKCSLFAICQSLNQKIKVEVIKPRKEQSDFYSVNPFEDYNGKDDGAVLAEHGWKVCGEISKFIYYTRPGKTAGISASFNKETNMYYIFTSSSELDPSKGYFPSKVLSILKFSCDGKATYKWLVENGYGKVNKAKELKIAENSAKRKKPLPNNFSDEAKVKYQETSEKIAENYPYGEFIKVDPEDDKGKLEVSRDALYYIAEKMGFKCLDVGIVKVEEYMVRKCTEREFYDEMKGYIKEDVPEELEKLLNIWEKFIQQNGNFTMTRLPEFDTKLLIKDDKGNAFQFFRNGWLHITSRVIEFKDYSLLTQLVFKEKIRDRDYVETDESGLYGEYLENAVGFNEYTCSIIGFLVHDFKNSSTGFIPVLTEMCENPEEGGGSGKNLFCNLLAHATSFVNKNCAGVKYNEKFWQMWTGQRIVALSDLPKNFDFGFIKEAATGSILHKRLFKDEVEIPVERTPKIVCQTNYSVENVDGGIRRRIRLLEFTDFYTKTGGIDEHHKKHFPEDWSTEDWNGFDCVIAMALKLYLKQGCKILSPTITATGWNKRFKQTYGPTTTEIISKHFSKWTRFRFVSNPIFDNDLEVYYGENKTTDKFKVARQKLNMAIKEYSEHHGFLYEWDSQKRGEGRPNEKHRSFLKKQEYNEI